MPAFTDTVRGVRLTAIILVSSVHEDAHLRSIGEAFRARLASLGVQDHIVVKSDKEVGKAVEALRASDGAIMVFLSGGTSRFAINVYEETRKPPLMIAHEYHNASASMMSAQSRIRFELGGRVAGWVTTVPDSPKLAALVTAYRTAVALSKLHVVQIDADQLSRDAARFQEAIGGRVTLVSEAETEKLLKAEMEKPSKTVEELADFDLGGTSSDGVKRALAVYGLAYRLLEKFDANAFTVDCFPFIVKHHVTPCLAMSRLLDAGYVAACEADYRALTLLAVSLGLTGLPGWIGNFNALEAGSRFKLSHCTIASRLTRYVTLLPHFETGNPYAVAGPLRDGVYTITALSPDYTVLWYVKAKHAFSGTISGGKCRTQAVFELEQQVDETSIVSNHHVVIPGDVAEGLKIVANYLGIRLVRGGA